MEVKEGVRVRTIMLVSMGLRVKEGVRQRVVMRLRMR